MITKDQFAQSLARECDIAIHLFSKIPPGTFEYQPSPEQRTTVTLLRYLSICASAGIHCMVHKDWKLFAEYRERVKEMPAEEFPAAMERQKKEILEFFASTSEETLRSQEAPIPGGGILPLGLAILEGPLKWLAAYKMQLFLYAKASGTTALKTSNLWRGTESEAGCLRLNVPREPTPHPPSAPSPLTRGEGYLIEALARSTLSGRVSRDAPH